jgi:hypothetical protein
VLRQLWTWPENSGHFTKLERKGIHHLPEYYTDCHCTSIACESGKKSGNSCCVKLDIKEIHHQCVSPTVELSGQSLKSNPRRFHCAQTENNVFFYFHDETYVLINVSESITIFMWLNYNSESSLTVFVFQVSLPIDLKFVSDIC